MWIGATCPDRHAMVRQQCIGCLEDEVARLRERVSQLTRYLTTPDPDGPKLRHDSDCELERARNEPMGVGVPRLTAPICTCGFLMKGSHDRAASMRAKRAGTTATIGDESQ